MLLRWSIVAFLLISALTLVGLAQTEDGLEVTPLTVWTWQPNGSDLAEDYQIENPQVRVTVRRFNSGAELYQAVLTAMQTGGEGLPDVMRLEYAFLPLLQSRNAVMPLQSLLPAETQARFPAWAWKQASLNGNLYTLPVDTSPMALVYRADLLAKYKIAPPTTWAQLVTAAAKVYKDSKGTVRLFNFDSSSSLWFLALAQSSGARVWELVGDGYAQRLNHAVALQMADALGGALARGWLTTLPSSSLAHHQSLRDGKLLMSAVPLSVAVSLARVLRVPGGAKYRLAPLPGLTKLPATGADWGGSGCAVGALSQQSQAASKYCLWLSTNPVAQQKSWQRDGLLSVALEAQLESSEPAALTVFYGGQRLSSTFRNFGKPIQSQTWVPWLPMTDAVYRKLGLGLVKGDLTLGVALERWQATVLKEAHKLGFTIK